MNFGELKDEVLILVDSGTTEIDDMVPGFVNDAVQYIANEPGIVLPSLKTIRNISTELDQEYATLESVFNGKLLFASVGGVKIDAHKSLEDLLNDYPTMQEYGSVEAVALEGATVWYANIPEEVETMTLLLCLNPDTLILDADIPASIPEHLHRSLIVPCAAKFAYESMGRGEDTEETNIAAQEINYQKGLIKLREFLAARRRGMSRSIWTV